MIEILLGHDSRHDLKGLFLPAEIDCNLNPLQLRVEPEPSVLIDRKRKRLVPRVLVALGLTHWSASFMVRRCSNIVEQGAALPSPDEQSQGRDYSGGLWHLAGTIIGNVLDVRTASGAPGILMAKHPIPQVFRFVPALADELELGLIPQHVAAFQVNLQTSAPSLYRLAETLQ
jgi:hypothetical protein